MEWSTRAKATSQQRAVGAVEPASLKEGGSPGSFGAHEALGEACILKIGGLELCLSSPSPSVPPDTVHVNLSGSHRS